MRHVAAPKVLQIVTRLGAGGVPLVVIQNARILQALGYNTQIVAGHCDHVDLDMSYLLGEQDDVAWIPEMSRSLSLTQDMKALWRLYRLMRSVRPTVVQTHTSKAGVLGRIAARLAGVPIVVHTFHGHVFQGYFSPLATFLIRTVERSLAKISDFVCVPGSQQARDLVENFRVVSARKMRVMPLGIDVEPFERLSRRRLPHEHLVVGWLGRLVEVKNIALLIEVMSEVFQRTDRIRFIVAGDGTQRELMEAAVRRWAPERLRWLGWLQDVTGTMGECDVLAQTSHSEGTPVALIQGMAAALPFVSTAAGGVVDMVTGFPVREQDGCRWFKNAVLAESDPAAFASALCELERNRARVKAMGMEAQAFARERHSLAALARNYGDFYQELLAKVGMAAPPRGEKPTFAPELLEDHQTGRGSRRNP